MGSPSPSDHGWLGWRQWSFGLVLVVFIIILLIVALIAYRISISAGYTWHCDVTCLAKQSNFAEFPIDRDQATAAMNDIISKDVIRDNVGNILTPNRHPTSRKSELRNLFNLRKPSPRKKRVAVVSVSIGDRPFARISKNRLERYCKFHGYDLFYHTENLDNRYKPFWQKVVAMRRVLDITDKHGMRKYDMAFWIDDDIYITNMGYRIEDFSILAENKDIIMSRDIIDTYNIYINTGTYIVRNTEIGRKFLDETLDGYYWYKGWYQENRFHEQTIMTYLYFRNYHKHSAVLPHGVMQSFYRGNHWKYGDFGLHIAGESTKTRTEIMAIMDQCDEIVGEPQYPHAVTTDEWRYIMRPTFVMPPRISETPGNVIFIGDI